MVLETIIWFVLVIIAALVIWKVTKSIMKAVFLAISFGVLILLIVGGLIVSDTMNFKEQFPTEPSLYLYKVNDKYVAGFSGILQEDFEPDYLSKERLTEFNAIEDLDSILGSNYKIFIIKDSAFDDINAEIQDLPKKTIDNLIASETPIDDYIKLQMPDVSSSQLPLARQQVLSQLEIKGDSEFKAALFGSLFSISIEQEGPLFLFDQYKQENVIVHPETMMFKLMKKIPNFILKGAIKVQGE